MAIIVLTVLLVFVPQMALWLPALLH